MTLQWRNASINSCQAQEHLLRVQQPDQANKKEKVSKGLYRWPFGRESTSAINAERISTWRRHHGLYKGESISQGWF